MNRLVSVACLALIALPLLAADECADELPNQPDAESAAPAVTLGEVATADADGWRVTVTSVRRVASVNVFGKTKTALGVYVAVEAQIEQRGLFT